MQFSVRYLDARGEPRVLQVEASSPQEARLRCRIPERRILDVKEKSFWRFLQKLETGTPGMKNQAIFLQNLSSALAAGKPIRESIESLIKNSKWIKVKQERLDQCEDLSDFLRLLNFDKNSILLAETAQRSGQYTQALRRASRYLIEKEQIGSEVDKELRMGYVYLVCGFAFITMLPFFMSYAIEEIRQAVGAEFQGNEVTALLLGWHSILNSYWPVLVITAIAGFVYWEKLFVLLKNMPLMATYYYKKLLDRSQRFINAYELLHESGIVDTQALLAILEASEGEDRIVFQRIYARLAGAQDLATAFTEEDWPMALNDVMKVIPVVTLEEKQLMLSAVKETIHIEHVHVSRVLAGVVSKAGFFMMLLAVIASAIGFYVPLANMASSFGG
ncbi:MAG TPA: hypothetical protein DHW71_04955 [Gammaproteobacteria bacterium]|nr:hypothetical protein [Gammaproteobacteria bacterium]HBF06924.1 hypothetical protein [Gammaproteobacteria bacterium]HCK92312.1 hypothetical protein [Gammaproteobacteria bacterium]|tara:strand:+ start:579 stop:1745 length:1167 start_codon:yes stop_codon:yes gene_type:complete